MMIVELVRQKPSFPIYAVRVSHFPKARLGHPIPLSRRILHTACAMTLHISVEDPCQGLRRQGLLESVSPAGGTCLAGRNSHRRPYFSFEVAEKTEKEKDI